MYEAEIIIKGNVCKCVIVYFVKKIALRNGAEEYKDKIYFYNKERKTEMEQNKLDILTQKAENGDFDSMVFLANYYLRPKDPSKMQVSKAFKWFGAISDRTNNLPETKLAASLGHMLGYSMIRSDKNSWRFALDALEKALGYSEKSLKLGDKDSLIKSMDIRTEMGHAYLLGMREYINDPDKKELYESCVKNAVKFLKIAVEYSRTGDCKYYLGDALSEYFVVLLNNGMDINDVPLDDELLLIKCFTEFINENKPDHEHVDTACCSLGIQYTYGSERVRNYDLGYKYYKMANDLGFDCSEDLSCFVRDSNGRYTLK